MKDFISFITMLIAGVAILFGLSFSVYEANKFFSPRYEETRRLTYEQSAAYNQGMVRDLENLQMDYERALPEQRVALKPIILHRFSVYNFNMLPANLQLFYISLKGTP